MNEFDDPKNWSPLRQEFTAHKRMKKLIEGPREEIRESLVRRVLAKQYGVKPEEITWKQIQFEVSELLRTDPALVLIPTIQSQSEPDPPLTSDQAWNFIQEDFTLRLSLLVDDMRTQFQKDLSELEFEIRKKGNVGYYFYARVELEIRHIDACAEKYWATCREIWSMQGRRESQIFYRAIFDHCLTPMFAIRKGAATSELQMRDVRIGTPGASTATLGHLAAEVNRLTAKWNTKLQIAARDLDHVKRIALERAPRPSQNETVLSGEPLDKTTGHTSSKPRLEARKLNTQAKYKRWKREYRSLRLKYPNKSDSWIAGKIAETDLNDGCSVETIRKQMKK
jgi:hypothetical protein